MDFSLKGFIRGFKAGIPIALGVASYGLVFGILSRQAVLTERFKDMTRFQKYLSLFFLVDETWAYSLSQWKKGNTNAALLAGSGFCLFRLPGRLPGIQKPHRRHGHGGDHHILAAAFHLYLRYPVMNGEWKILPLQTTLGCPDQPFIDHMGIGHISAGFGQMTDVWVFGL